MCGLRDTLAEIPLADIPWLISLGSAAAGRAPGGNWGGREHLVASGSIWEHLGALGGLGALGAWQVHDLLLKCGQTAATDHSTVEWRRSEAQSTVNHMVLARAPSWNSPGETIAQP